SAQSRPLARLCHAGKSQSSLQRIGLTRAPLALTLSLSLTATLRLAIAAVALTVVIGITVAVTIIAAKTIAVDRTGIGIGAATALAGGAGFFQSAQFQQIAYRMLIHFLPTAPSQGGRQGQHAVAGTDQARHR